jgi:chromosome segregation ATPase
MSIFRFFFDYPQNVAAKRQSSTKRAKNGFDQGGERFLPTVMQGDRRKNEAFDAEGRRWPELPIIPQNRIAELESKIAKQSAELTQRCAQVADLCNIREQQAIDLLNACDQIDLLSDSIARLQDTITQHETEAAATKQKLILSDIEKCALRAQLENARGECGDLLQRTLRAETALNDKDMSIASILEKVEDLKTKLAATPAELKKVIEEENTRHRRELNEQRAHLNSQIRNIEGAIVERDAKLKDLKLERARLAERCHDLLKTVNALENTRQCTREKIDFQTGQIQAFETLFSIEREAMELKIKDLTVELQQKRLEDSAAECRSAALRKNIVLLLPKLVARGNPPTSREQEMLVPRITAA